MSAQCGVHTPHAFVYSIISTPKTTADKNLLLLRPLLFLLFLLLLLLVLVLLLLQRRPSLFGEREGYEI